VRTVVLLAVAGAVVGVGVAVAATRDEAVRATVAPRPATIEAGTAWAPAVTVKGSSARPVLVAGGRSFRATATARRGVWRLRVLLPQGRWPWTLRVGRATPARGVLTVLPRPAELEEPFALAIDRAGALLVADRAGHRVVRIDPGTLRMTPVAGNGQNGFSGDGGPATAAALGEPIEVEVAPDGSVYVVSTERVRRIAADGTISTVAGNGTRGYAGDGGPAAAAVLNAPMGLAFDAAGHLFVAEYENRVRRIDAQTGIVTTAAGTGEEGYSGDGGPARAARISHPHGVAVAPDGDLLIADTWNNRLRRVDSATGTIAHVAELATPAHLVAAPDGTIYSVEARDGSVRRIAPGGAISTVARGLDVPNHLALAGAALYVVEFEGRRVRRIDLRTGRISTVAR
jgi:DNA-binding beta-propeller fold protein YncE